jgi:methylmalonyl-CoA mutase N-terminal domain/subunit
MNAAVMSSTVDLEWKNSDTHLPLTSNVAFDTLADMEEAFDGIDLNKITVSLTINGAAVAIMAMYFAMATSGNRWRNSVPVGASGPGS